MHKRYRHIKEFEREILKLIRYSIKLHPLPAMQCKLTICCLNSGVYDFSHLLNSFLIIIPYSTFRVYGYIIVAIHCDISIII